MRGAVVVAAVLGGMTAVAGWALTRKAVAKAKLTEAEVLAADNLAELDAYYTAMGLLYIASDLSDEQYRSLYSAYASRFNELVS